LPVEIPTPDITTNSDEEFSNNGTRSDLVKEVYLSNLVLSIKSPEDKTFSFLKSIHIYIRTNDSDEVELAYKDNVNSDAKFINLDLTHERLDKYIKADSYKLRTEVSTRETLTQDVTIVVDMSFKVTADPL
jgi:alanine dehydrogenase